MHTCDANSNVPAFLIKLWKLVEDGECNNLITWSENGTSFIIRDSTKFAKDLLPQYFKHSNMASFIRQLNMYGFRKVLNYEKTSLRCENDEMEFQHAFFCKGQGELLELIKRKIPNAKVVEPTVKSNAKDILTDLTSIREKQENMDTMLIKMKQENELLWRELTSMRQKHKAQEQIIQKVIQFLVSIVQRSNQNIGVGVKRKIPRMIHDSLGSKAKTNQVARHLNVIRKNNSDRFLTVKVPQDKVISPLGPVIHEVTDFDHDEVEDPNVATNIQSPQANSVASSPASVNINVTDGECLLNCSINSPIDTSDTMEPLSILEPLASASYIPITDCDEIASEECIEQVPEMCIKPSAKGSIEPSAEDFVGHPATLGTSEEEILGLPHDFPVSNVISIPEDSFLLAAGTSSAFPLVFSPSIREESPVREEVVMTESLQTPKIEIAESPLHTALFAAAAADEAKQDENNYQITPLSDSSLVKSNSLSKNSLSSHLVDVEEELKWLQDQISSSTWNLDASKLLGVCPSWDKWTSLDTQLFSNDDVANNEHVAEQFANESSKLEKSDIIGNELVQFTPSMLQLDDFDADNPPFMDYLIGDMPSEMIENDDPSCENNDLDLLQILGAAPEDDGAEIKPVASESVLKSPGVAKRQVPPKHSKVKHKRHRAK